MRRRARVYRGSERWSAFYGIPARHPALGRNPALKNIFVVAHPEASHHRDGLVGGWFDSDLTERGVRHADNIADALLQRLRGTEVQIRTSDLHRARRTAEIIGSRLGTTPKIDPDLREKSFGEAEGKPQQWLRERTIPLPEHGERLQHDEGIPGAETRMDLAQRAYTAMARIQESPAVDQVIVTHGGTITFLIAAWIGMPIEASGRAHFQASSGSITVLRKDPRNVSHQLVQLNDVSHLSA